MQLVEVLGLKVPEFGFLRLRLGMRFVVMRGYVQLQGELSFGGTYPQQGDSHRVLIVGVEVIYTLFLPTLHPYIARVLISCSFDFPFKILNPKS